MPKVILWKSRAGVSRLLDTTGRHHASGEKGAGHPSHKTPTTTRQVRHFIRMINYYCDMWAKRSEILAPLTKLCSSRVKFEWGEPQQKAFDNMKQILSWEVLLAYPNFSKLFEIHMDASATKLRHSHFAEWKTNHVL